MWAGENVTIESYTRATGKGTSRKPKLTGLDTETSFSHQVWGGIVEDLVDCATDLTKEARTGIILEAKALAKQMNKRATKASATAASIDSAIPEPLKPKGRRARLVDAPLPADTTSAKAWE